MKWFIPVICAWLFRMGGWGRVPFMFVMPAKWWRWIGIGIFFAVTYWNPWIILTYYLATNVPYGDNSFLKKVMTRRQNWLLYGFCFGLASFPVLGLWMGLVQGVIASAAFCGLMTLSNEGVKTYCHKGIPKVWYLDHKYVEIGTGFLGTIVYWIT